MSSTSAQFLPPETPIFFLKTKSTPIDAYEQLFATPQDGLVFKPTFLPVLKHHFESQGVASVTELLEKRKIGAGGECSYGGLIFTSQRAVEAFAKLVEDGKGPFSSIDSSAFPMSCVFSNRIVQDRQSRLATLTRRASVQRRTRDHQGIGRNLAGATITDLRRAHRQR